ncbi:hypothetical protein [Caulobacter sp. 17J65-9]|uniref:hypothetical protein n=1 Tax=Caulobacter sp. 17J65-9 TaxID=2709382 RepID=UPI0013CA7059|nr:hypothetical protein [Caulobacter sp. 17J65-9]NEX92616.1 hypothetical protein [Caulobacter sp. 17J65-9]
MKLAWMLVMAVSAAICATGATAAEKSRVVLPITPTPVEIPPLGPLWTVADGTCLWERLEPQTRAALLEAPPLQFDEMLDDLTKKPMARAAEACGLSMDGESEVGVWTLFTTAKRAHSERHLEAEEGLTPARLDAAWNALGAEAQTRLATAIKTGDKPGWRVPMAKLRELLGVPDASPDTRHLLANYALSRAFPPGSKPLGGA